MALIVLVRNRPNGMKIMPKMVSAGKITASQKMPTLSTQTVKYSLGLRINRFKASLIDNADNTFSCSAKLTISNGKKKLVMKVVKAKARIETRNQALK